jgi:hypothetical protein
MVSTPAIPPRTNTPIDQQPNYQKWGSPLIQIKPAIVSDVVEVLGRQLSHRMNFWTASSSALL